MGLLDELTGGGNLRAQHFTDRYHQGQPHEGYDDQEVASRYDQVTSEVDPSTYRDAAQQAFTRMDPGQRREFGAQLNQHAAAQGQQSDYHDSATYEDPQQLADMTTRLHQQSPGLLSQLLSGAGVGGAGAPGGLTGAGNSGVWPTLRAADARTMIRFLVDAFGFEEVIVYGEGDHVDHAELAWPPGGGVMLGSRRDDPHPLVGPASSFSAYLVTDEPDALHARALAAGAEEVRPLQDTEYGSREFAVRDPEGGTWSFGTYRGHPR